MARSGRLSIDSAAPRAARRPHRVERHGLVLDDPYHWLRDPAYPEVEDAAILGYLREENDYFAGLMAPHSTLVATLYKELEARQQQDDESVPYLDRGYYYQWRFAPGDQYRRWYRWPANGTDVLLLLDEPALAADQEYFRLGGYDISSDDRYLAWAEDVTGSERFRIRVRDLHSGEILDDELTEVAGAPLFVGDGRDLVYVALHESWRPYQVRLHRLGQPVADDLVLYDEPDDAFFVGVDTTQSDAYIVIASGDHVTNELRLLPMADPRATPQLLVARRSGVEYDIDHGGGDFYIRVNDVHKNFRLVSTAVERLAPEHWQEVIAPSASRYLRGHVAFENALVVHERVDGLDQVRIRHGGEEHCVQFPEPVYAVWLGPNAEPAVGPLRLGYSSLVTPITVYDYDLDQRCLITRKVQAIPSGYDATQYASERLWVTARDGARVPVSVVYRKDFVRDGTRPLHLYGYGAYGLGEQPFFSSGRLSLLDRGFAYAIAHIRGGDDLGYAWYEAGKKEHRENTFRDFVDVAAHLCAAGYTQAGRISISGGSAGGTLVGAVLNMAPALWGAAVAHVPFVDVLNTMLDATLPLTPIEWPEWGNPDADPAAFELIRGYSPYENVVAQDYPPLLVTAGLHDPRVTYWEPAKWVAQLRATKQDDNVLALKTNMAAGHGGKSGRFVALEELAEEYAFILCVLSDAAGTAAG